MSNALAFQRVLMSVRLTSVKCVNIIPMNQNKQVAFLYWHFWLRLDLKNKREVSIFLAFLLSYALS